MLGVRKSYQKGSSLYKTKRILGYYIIPKGSLSISYQTGPCLYHTKWVIVYIIQKGSLSISYQTGPCLYHTKWVLVYIIPKRSLSISYQTGLCLYHTKWVLVYIIRNGPFRYSTKRDNAYFMPKGARLNVSRFMSYQIGPILFILKWFWFISY